MLYVRFFSPFIILPFFCLLPIISRNSDPGSQSIIGSSPLPPDCGFRLDRRFFWRQYFRPFLPPSTICSIEMCLPTQLLISALSRLFRFIIISIFTNQLKSPIHVGFELQHQLLVAFVGTARPRGGPVLTTRTQV